jgi:hypothetical protein
VSALKAPWKRCRTSGGRSAAEAGSSKNALERFSETVSCKAAIGSAFALAVVVVVVGGRDVPDGRAQARQRSEFRAGRQNGGAQRRPTNWDLKAK